jgi:hypothetical protein
MKFEISKSQIARKKREGFLIGSILSIGGLIFLLTTEYHAKDGGETIGIIFLILGFIGFYRAYVNKSFYEHEAPYIRYSIRNNHLEVTFSKDVSVDNETPALIDLDKVKEVLVQERSGIVHALKIIMENKQEHKMLGLNDTWSFVQEIEKSVGKNISKKVWRYIN